MMMNKRSISSVLVILFQILFIIFFSSTIYASEVEEKFDKIYSLIEKGKIKKDNSGYSKTKDIITTPHPYKIRFCKSKDGITFTVLKPQGCYYFEYDSDARSQKVIKGKKINRKEYIASNNDFNEETNLICLQKSSGYGYRVYYITHTLLNKIYLNSIINITTNLSITDLYGDSIKDKLKYKHQGEVKIEGYKHRFIFYNYYDKNFEHSWPGPSIGFSISGPESNEYHKCYASDETYWAMLDNNIANKPKANTQIVNNSLLNSLDEDLANLDEERKEENQNTTTLTSSTSEIGVYENIVYPLEMKNKLGNRDPSRVAGTEVSFRFIKKKSTLSKYPNKLMEAMAWMEVLYNEKIKYPQKVKFDDVKGLLEARNSMRESVGLDINVSAQDAIDTYWVMSILLSKTKYEKRDVDPALLERKKALNDLKTALRKAKEKYLEEVQGDKS